MKLKRLIILPLLFTFILLIVEGSFAQHTNFNTQKNWSLNKKEILFGLGATQFLGDLGGKDQIGTDYSLKDIDWASTSFGGMVGFRYRFKPHWATTTTVNVGMLKGDDALTNEIIRNSRNLHFRTIIVELAQRIEWIILAKEQFGARYRMSGKKFMRERNDQLYVFGGIGINYFNPKANYNGEWIALRPLGTEGQGLEGAPRKPLPFTATIPFGIGGRIGLNRMWRIGIEASYIKTFSDYIDDVGQTYYDPAAIGAAYGQTAAYLSNPSTNNTTWFVPGSQRGDKQKDAYFYLNVVVTRNITYKDYAKERKASQWRGGRYKF